jgi:hypothetical protein
VLTDQCVQAIAIPGASDAPDADLPLNARGEFLAPPTKHVLDSWALFRSWGGALRGKWSGSGLFKFEAGIGWGRSMRVISLCDSHLHAI